MGMDVYGNAPTAEVGEYFRRSVWGWHPLWDLVEDVCPWVLKAVPGGHYNDGEGLDAQQALRLADELAEMLADKTITRYIEKRNHTLAELPDVPCQWCEGTGVRTDEVGQQMKMPERNWCNGCDGKGFQQDSRRMYQVSVEDVEEFAEFVRHSGGFRIH